MLDTAKALPFGDARIKELQTKFSMSGIPMLVLLKGSDGSVITTDGRGAIMQPDKFPWEGFGNAVVGSVRLVNLYVMFGGCNSDRLAREACWMGHSMK
jgi:hypothetical protein